MIGRLWPVALIAICFSLSGCSGNQEETNKAGKAQAKNQDAAAQPKPKKKASRKEEKEPEKPVQVSTTSLLDLLPESLTIGLGAQTAGLAELTDATGTDFLAELHPTTKLLTRGGLKLEDVEELWVGSNPRTNDSAVCVKMKKPYDKANLRAGLQIAQPLGTIDGKEVHALPSQGELENAIAFVDDKIFLLGRRQTVEDAMKRPTGGPLRRGLAVAKTDNAGYWAAGDADSYLQLLGHHGFGDFATYSSKFTHPVAFALTIPTKAAAKQPQAKPRSSGRGFGRGRGDDDEEEERQRLANVAAQNGRNAAGNSRSDKTITLAMGFAFESEREALQMERQARSILDSMKAKLQASASLQLTLTEPEVQPGRSVSPVDRRQDDESDSEEGREPGRRGRNPKRDLLRDNDGGLRIVPSPASDRPADWQVFPFQRGEDERDNRRNRRINKRGEDDDDDDEDGGSRRIRFGRGGANLGEAAAGQQTTTPRSTATARNSSLNRRVANITFNQTITREGANLRIQLELNMPPGMMSIVASVLRAAGNSLTGDGIRLGSFPAIVSGLDSWRNVQHDTIRGVKKIPDLPVIAGYSWMTELLPFLNQQQVYLGFDFDKDWISNADNRRHAGTVIPEFLNPAAENAKWQGYPYDGLGLTHFVGMSGVEDGPNVLAAALDRNDPRAGIFGYDSIAKTRQITDGAANTIMLIGAGKLAGPWVQGGGATIRGAREPYFDEVSGFGSAGLAQRGAYVLLADGSMRTISADIDPVLFRAMCTIHGAEQIDLKQLGAAGGTNRLAGSPDTPKSILNPPSSE